MAAWDSFTELFAGIGGDKIYNEILSGAIKLAVTKIHTGAGGVDGGPVGVANPLHVELSDGATQLGTAGNPLLVAPGTGALFDVSSRLARLIGRVSECDPAGNTWTDHAPVAWGSSAGTVIKASAGYLRWLNITNASSSVAIQWWLLDASSAPAYSSTPANVITSGVLAAGGAQGTRVDCTPTGWSFVNGLVLVASTSGTAYTAPGSNYMSYAVKYN